MKRKFLASILAMCVCIASAGFATPHSVSAAAETYGDFEYNVSEGEVTITDFVGSSHTTDIIIPSEINGYPVTTIGERAFISCYNLESIEIPDSVITIGKYAFAACESLKSIKIPDSVTTIGEEAFGECSSLENIQIPDSITSIGRWAFYNTAYYDDETNWADGVLYIGNHLIKADRDLSGQYIIPDGIKTIGNYAFEDCRDLEGIEIPDSVTAIGDYAFSWCNSIESINLGNGITTIGKWAFVHCESISSLEIPDNLSTIGERAFYYCKKLESITIPESVTTIGNMAFASCRSLESVNVDTNNANFASEDGVLFNKNKTTLIVYPPYKTDISYIIPNSVTSIGDMAFYYCKKLKSITIPESVTTFGESALEGCYLLESIDVDTNNVNFTSENGVLFNKNITTLFIYPSSKADTEYTIPASVTVIDDKAFEECCDLESIVIPDGVTTIGDYAFAWCESLESIQIPDSITSIGEGAFENTAYYNDKSNWTDEVLYIGNHLIIANSWGQYEEYIIPDGTKTIADWAFYEFYELESITIPDSVTNIGNYAFAYVDGLTNIILGNGVTAIGEGAFEGCYAESIEIPDSVTSIGESAFAYCDDLTNVTIGNGVTTIGNRAFASCGYLTNVTIGSGVKTIGEGAFDDCDDIENVYYRGYEEKWNSIDIGYDNEYLTENVTFLGGDIYSTSTTVSPDGKTFTVSADDTVIGKTVILALYKGDCLSDMGYGVYTSDALEFTTDADYDRVLVYVWNSLSEMSSDTVAEPVR